MLLCAFLQSLPLRECGLKYRRNDGKMIISTVTPLAGVWIEIGIAIILRANVIESLPLRECGLKF